MPIPSASTSLDVLGKDEDMKARIRRYIIGLPIIMIIYLGLIFMYIYPHKPVDFIGWLVLIFFGIPIALFVEWIGEQVFNYEVGKDFTSKRISIKRVMVALFVILVLIGLFSVVLFAFKPLFHQHFS